MIRIRLSSIFVNDQERALEFYTGVLGFAKKMDLPAGAARWLTVVSPAGPDEVELVLEPNGNPTASAYQQGLFAQGIPCTAFEVDDLTAEVERLKGLGVRFTMEPTDVGTVTIAVFDDTCGNLVQLYQVPNS